MFGHLADLESDFSVFHGVDDIYSMWAPDFMRKAWRITAYRGMVWLRLEAQRARARDAETAATAPVPAGATPAPAASAGGTGERPAAGRLPPGSKVVPVAVMAMQFPGLFDRRRVAADAPAAG